MSDLAILLSTVLAQVVADMDRDHQGDLPLPYFANVLRCVDDDGISARDLATSTRVSSRLLTTALGQATRAGWIVVDGSGKSANVRPTDEGAAGANHWRRRLDEIDETWASTPLRAALEDLVTGLPFEMPHHPASYGAADPSAVGGPFVQNAKRTDGVPAHGTDWKPVPRTADADVAGLPITALLSQALMAFTVDYEDRFPWPLASTANVLVHVGSEPRPLADLPAGHGIAGNGKSLLERHQIVDVTDGQVVLTDRGRQVLEHHPIRLAATEQIWRDRHGANTVDALVAALEPLAAQAADQPAHLIWST